MARIQHEARTFVAHELADAALPTTAVGVAMTVAPVGKVKDALKTGKAAGQKIVAAVTKTEPQLGRSVVVVGNVVKAGKTADVVSKRSRVKKSAPGPNPHPQAFPQQAKRYIEDMTSRSGMEIPKNQRDLLGDAVRGKKFVKLDRIEKTKHSDLFTKSKKNKLIQEWETNTGQQWPTYQEAVYSKRTGNLLKSKGDTYDAHHIIPQQHGGPHEWWNMHPLKMGEDHQGFIHGANSSLTKIVNEAKQ